MDKNTSISLHLAKVMGLQNIQTAPEQYQVSERVTHELTDIRREIFNPFTNRAQWADVLIFMLKNRYNIDFPGGGLEETVEEMMASYLMEAALATGWAG